MKEKLKTTSFWLGLSGACVMIADCIAELFDIEVCTGTIENIILTIASVLVMLGIVTKRSTGDKETVSNKEELLEDLAQSTSDEEKED